jgi:hypothetical protein
MTCVGLLIALFTNEIAGFSIATGKGKASKARKLMIASDRAILLSWPTSVPSFTF